LNKREEEGKHRKDINIGIAADKILNDPLVVEYFDNARRGIMEKLETSEFDAEAEKEAIRMLKAFSHFERDFRKKINKGNKAKTLLDRLLQR